MKQKLARWLGAVAAACGLACAHGVAFGQSDPAAAYPSRQIRIIVPYSAGGSTDALARLVAEVPIVPTLEDEGVRVVVVHVVGPDLADLDYLDRFEQDDLFAPEATLICVSPNDPLTASVPLSTLVAPV